MAHPNQPAQSADPVTSFLASVRLAPRQAYKALTVWPLVRRDNAPPLAGPVYEPIAGALARGDVRVDEVDDSGQVPHVRVSNRGEKPVLFLFGEEIIGALQNRVANATFLVPARGQVVLDVSCVEAGRWDRGRKSDAFTHAAAPVSSLLRRKMAKAVTRSRASGAGFHADQAEVWDEVATRLDSTGTRSPSQAWSDYRESRSTDLDECERAFSALPGQVGFVASIGDKVAGLEAIGRPEVFEASFGALLRSYAIDAVDAGFLRETTRSRDFDAPEPFLAALELAERTWNPSLGLGSDLRLAGAGVEGCALACEGLVHLTAFPGAR